MYRDTETLKFELMDEVEERHEADSDDAPAWPKWEEPLSPEEMAQIAAEELALAAELAADAFMMREAA